MDAEYNDIAQWDFKGLVDVMGGKDVCKKYTVKTKDELNGLLADKTFSGAEVLQFVELYMPKEDAPRSLALTAEANAKNNSKRE